MSDTESRDRERGEPITKRGLYLMADTPLTAHPVAVEDGSGDKGLLAECIAEELTDEEIDGLINELISYRVRDDRDGTAIVCDDCGHVRQTTERHPTLVNCESCGSHNVRYRDTGSSRNAENRDAGGGT